MGEDRQGRKGGRGCEGDSLLISPVHCASIAGTREGGRRLQNLHGGEEFALNGGRRFDGRNGQTSERPPRRSYCQSEYL